MLGVAVTRTMLRAGTAEVAPRLSRVAIQEAVEARALGMIGRSEVSGATATLGARRGARVAGQTTVLPLVKASRNSHGRMDSQPQ